MPTDSKQRFSNRVADYVKYRPDYSREILATLRDRMGFDASWIVADVGSGTGISSRMFLENGNAVIGIEPNAEMRRAGEEFLSGFDCFRSVDASAEATTLADASVDLIVAGQAFHWFDRERTRGEFRRILRAGGWCAFIWNVRKVSGTPFLEAYEALLLKYGSDYSAVRHENIDDAAFRDFFSPREYERINFPNVQMFDLDGVIGRCMSSSYAPHKGNPNHEAMLSELREMFERYETGGKIAFDYQTELNLGQLGA